LSGCLNCFSIGLEEEQGVTFDLSYVWVNVKQVKVREVGHMGIEECAIMQERESEKQVLSPCACPPMKS
jgi:hypothetical protein